MELALYDRIHASDGTILQKYNFSVNFGQEKADYRQDMWAVTLSDHFPGC